MSWTERLDFYQNIGREIDPAVRLTTKDGWFWKMLAVLATVFTFGGIQYRVFLEDYATTIGPVQAYPRAWRTLSRPLLIHEAQHTRQSRWCGLWIHPWVGLPIFGILYLLVLLPVGFAFFRWRFEINADAAAWRWMLRNGAQPHQIRSRANLFGKKVCGGNYGWSFLPWGVGGFKRAAEDVIHEFRKEAVNDSRLKKDAPNVRREPPS